MGEPAKKPAGYEDLYAILESAIGEIIDHGRIPGDPRPAGPEAPWPSRVFAGGRQASTPPPETMGFRLAAK